MLKENLKKKINFKKEQKNLTLVNIPNSQLNRETMITLH